MNIKAIVKSLFGDNKRQKIIGRLFISFIVLISMALVLISLFHNLSKLNEFNDSVLDGLASQSKMLSLNLKIKKMNNEMIESEKIATNALLFQSLNDISGFIEYLSKIMDKNNYLIQFKMLKTIKDNDLDIYKTTIYFELINIINDGNGYERGLIGINEVLKESDKKVDLTSLSIFGNLNDINKITLKAELWCNFEYKAN